MLTRRKFIGRGWKATVFGIFVPELIRGQVPIPIGQFDQKPSSKTPTWYDTEPQAATDTDASGTVDALEWSSVSVTIGGSATKARIYLRDNSVGSANLKMKLYEVVGGASKASGTVSIPDTNAIDNAYLEVTFGTPYTVASSTTYLVAWIGDAGASFLNYRYKAGVDNWKAKLAFGYTTSPDTLPTGDFSLSRGYAVGLYVIPS